MRTGTTVFDLKNELYIFTTTTITVPQYPTVYKLARSTEYAN